MISGRPALLPVSPLSLLLSPVSSHLPLPQFSAPRSDKQPQSNQWGTVGGVVCPGGVNSLRPFARPLLRR